MTAGRGSLRVVFQLSALVMIILFQPFLVEPARGNPIGPFNPLSCMPMARIFSASHVSWLMDEWKKMSRQEFGLLPISPVGVATLPKGAELNVVIDTTCLLDPARGPAKLDWLVRLKDSVPPRSRGGTMHSFHWQLEEDWNFADLQQAFEEEPCVNLVSPEGKFYVSSIVNDPFVREQAHLTALDYHQVIRDFLIPIMVRHPVTIAVIDTGVDFSHPELHLNKWANQHEIPGNGIDDDGNGYIDDVNGYNFASRTGAEGPQGAWPDNKHGTHVAGLAAARIGNQEGGVGIHGIAKVMSLNVFGNNGFTRSSVLENAVRYAADHRADVINLSLGGREYSRSMRSALEYAIGRGSFIVAAAGNEGVELCDNPGSFDFVSPAVYGSSIDGMLVTASTDIASGKMSRFSNFSNRLVEIAAPGAFSSEGQMVGLLSAIPDNEYAFMAGTSMSAPILSGASALVISWMKAYGYSFTPQILEKILRESAMKETALAGQVQEGRTLNLMRLREHLRANFPPRRVRSLTMGESL
jgi:roadblock/LC7 domain-containing protein